MFEDARLEVIQRGMGKRAGSRWGKIKQEPSRRMKEDRQREQVKRIEWVVKLSSARTYRPLGFLLREAYCSSSLVPISTNALALQKISFVPFWEQGCETFEMETKQKELCKACPGTFLVRELFWGEAEEELLSIGPVCAWCCLIPFALAGFVLKLHPAPAVGSFLHWEVGADVSGSASQGHDLVPRVKQIFQRMSVSSWKEGFIMATCQKLSEGEKCSWQYLLKYSDIFSFPNWVSGSWTSRFYALWLLLKAGTP